MPLEVISAQWPAPANIRAMSTLRSGGVSGGSYTSFNLGLHVGDDESSVGENRRRLQKNLQLPSSPVWLHQVHGTRVVELSDPILLNNKADASFTGATGVVCVVLTADCLPVVFCNKAGTKIAVAHAGWRGLASGVIESTVVAMQEKVENLIVWLGPAIGPKAFEVGDEVVGAFVDYLCIAEQAFLATKQGTWMADLYLLACQRLNYLGIKMISGGEHCTYLEHERFFSYRREKVTGRMATLAWIERK